jgi:hypothetical protein
MYDATLVFVYKSCAIKCTLNSGKYSTKNTIRHICYCAAILADFFTVCISYVM